ncbi:MAG: hypothetical protein AAGL90_04155 [Pseudomonadota bacterium]
MDQALSWPIWSTWGDVADPNGHDPGVHAPKLDQSHILTPMRSPRPPEPYWSGGAAIESIRA